MGVFSHCGGKRVSAKSDYNMVPLSDLPVCVCDNQLKLPLGFFFSQALNQVTEV